MNTGVINVRILVEVLWIKLSGPMNLEDLIFQVTHETYVELVKAVIKYSLYFCNKACSVAGF